MITIEIPYRIRYWWWRFKAWRFRSRSTLTAPQRKSIEDLISRVDVDDFPLLKYYGISNRNPRGNPKIDLSNWPQDEEDD